MGDMVGWGTSLWVAQEYQLTNAVPSLRCWCIFQLKHSTSCLPCSKTWVNPLKRDPTANWSPWHEPVPWVLHRSPASGTWMPPAQMPECPGLCYIEAVGKLDWNMVPFCMRGGSVAVRESFLNTLEISYSPHFIFWTTNGRKRKPRMNDLGNSGKNKPWSVPERCLCNALWPGYILLFVIQSKKANTWCRYFPCR